MRVFVTGASGFVGSAIVRELIGAGHRVLGLARTDTGVRQIEEAGADAYRGDVNDLEFLQRGVAGCDAVIHAAFNHDFSRFKESCEADRRVIEALGEAMTGSDRPLVITSGIGVLGLPRVVTEDDVPAAGSFNPRVATEEAAREAAAQGTNVYIVRLPVSVHGRGDRGFVPMLIDLSRQKGVSAFAGDGANRWPAVHRLDAAVAYRSIVEQKPAQKVFHPVAEEGIAFRDIAEAVGRGLHLPVEGKSGQEAEAHFGWFSRFAALDCPASSDKTRKILGWEPVQVGLLEDLEPGGYFR